MLLGIAGRRRNNITAESSGWGFVFSNNSCDSDSPSIAEIIADPKNLRIRLWLYCHCGREDKIKVLPVFFVFNRTSLPVGKPTCCGESLYFIDTKYLTIFFIIVIVANY